MKEKLSSFQVAILLYMIQSGVVFFSLPRAVAEAFGTNGWAVLILIYFIVNLNIILIWYVFKVSDGMSMVQLLGYLPKWITLPLSLFLSIVWIGLGSMVLVKYSMYIKMLFFQNVSLVLLILMGLTLCYFMFQGGIYHISKTAVVIFFGTIWTIIILTFHVLDFSFVRMTPFFFEGEKDIIKGGIGVYTAFLGFELSMLFLKYADKIKLSPLLIGNTITGIIYISTCFLCFGFFSFDQLLKDLLPVMTLLEYISLPIVDRIENLIFTLFGLKVIITTVMYLWAAKEMVEFQFKRMKPVFLLPIILISSFIISLGPKVMVDVDKWLEYASYAGAGIAFVVPLLLLLIAFYLKYRKKGNVYE